MTADAAGSGFEAAARPKRLSAAVVAARDHGARANVANQRVLDAQIEAHLTAYRAAFDELEAAHRVVSDGTDLDLGASTRQAALWLMSGRCIAQGRAVLHLLSGGFANEVPVLLRQLYESTRLLDAFAMTDEEAIVRKWLGNEHVSQGEAARTLDRVHSEMRLQMVRAGAAPPRDVTSDLHRQYGHLSEYAHNRYSRVVNTVAIAERRMPIGAHPEWTVRAAAIGDSGQFLIGTVTVVGHALSMILGAAWFQDRFNPTFHALVELGQRIPLDAASLEREV